MDASSLSHGVSCAPYLALKHVAGSDQPVLYSFSEKKVDDIVDEENLSTYCTCLLSDYPADDAGKTTSSSSCLVLLVETDAPVIWYCLIGDKEWLRHEYDIGTLEYDGHSEKLVISPIVACRGKFYFNGSSFKEVGVLQFRPAPAFSSIIICNAITGPKGCRKVFVVESMQELYMISLMSAYLDLDVVHRCSVHKMDFVKDEWLQVDDIGDRVFLLSSWYFGASRSADECGLERNCIYMVYPWNKRVMIFNIGGQATKVMDLDGAPASDQALWMLPTHP
ncbi:hypothetical protein C2845_PM13G19900 [Panicum miliaceum]|uniref:KIB1-4 beta-propeller domain-containing protein n=1 Tax=Panicum miliaceum TaxID=4540 RepID=A0A3L6RGE3_PANMI|nr:hypothetical protein C2845_PM13G19900 [Panicum miliaceum]